MSTLKKWIIEHQVASFFILAFLITWPGFFAVFFIFPGNQIVEIIFSLYITFGPALSAMLISGLAKPAPKANNSRARWITFGITWVVASIIQNLYGWKVLHMAINPAVVIIFCIFGLVPAWILSSAYARTPGIREHFSTLLKPRGSWKWYLVIFLIFPGIQILAHGITKLMGGEAEFSPAILGFQGAAIYLFLEFSRGFLMTGGINEESGWRGFALPRLQARYPVIVAAGIVWFFWAFWHIPYDIGLKVPIRWMLENRIVWNLVVSILMTWLYNRTKGSILAPALFHPAMNTFGNAFSLNPVSRIMIIGLTLYAIISDRMWKKLPTDHSAVYQGSQIKESLTVLSERS